jgi:hypothetical protein
MKKSPFYRQPASKKVVSSTVSVTYIVVQLNNTIISMHVQVTKSSWILSIPTRVEVLRHGGSVKRTDVLTNEGIDEITED